MIKAIKDYKEMVWKPSWEWAKRHWIAYLVLTILLTGISIIPALVTYRKSF